MSPHPTGSHFLSLHELYPPGFLHPPMQLPVKEPTSAGCRLGTKPSCKHCALTPIPTLRGTGCYYSHFTGRETEAQRGFWFVGLFRLFILFCNSGDTTEKLELRSKPGSSKSRSQFITLPTPRQAAQSPDLVHSPPWVQQGPPTPPQPRGNTADKSLAFRPIGSGEPGSKRQCT